MMVRRLPVSTIMLEPLDSNALEHLLASTIHKLTENKQVCFALSGGVDSTLLAAIATRQGFTQNLVAYTAVSHAGADLDYALEAASILGIEIRRVSIPIGNTALDFYDEMSTRAGASLALVGNSIGFAAVCAAAKADGFEAIVDGTGAEQMTGGNNRIIVDWLALAEDAGLDDLISIFVARNGRSLVKMARKHPVRFDSMAAAIEHDLTRSKFTEWRDHHMVTACATNIQIISPFLSEQVQCLAHQPLEWYCPDGWLKSPLRKLLAIYVGDKIAYRKDNQGLRWPKSHALRECRARMRLTIMEHEALCEAAPSERVAFALRIETIGCLARLYREATMKRLGESRSASPSSNNA